MSATFASSSPPRPPPRHHQACCQYPLVALCMLAVLGLPSCVIAPPRWRAPAALPLVEAGPEGSPRAAQLRQPWHPADLGGDDSDEHKALLEELASEGLALEDCIDLALLRNRELRIARSGLDRSVWEIDRAAARLFVPEARLAYTWTPHGTDDATASMRLDGKLGGIDYGLYLRGEGQADGKRDFADDQVGSRVGLSLARRLLARHEHRSQRRPVTAAELAHARAEADYRRRTRELARDAARAFLDLQRTQASLGVREARVAEARRFLEATRTNVRLGFRAPFEALNAEINLNQAEADLLGEQARLRDAVESLAVLLALPPAVDLRIRPAQLEDLAPPAPDLERDLALLEAHHEDLHNRRLDLDLLAEDLLGARDDLLPDLRATLVAERRWQGDRPFAGSGEDVVRLGLEWRIPLDNDRADRLRLRQLERQYAERLLDYERARDELGIRLRRAHRTLLRRITERGLAENRLEAERTRFAATQRRYENGEIDNLELLRAQENVERAEIGLLSARIDLVLGLSDYRVLVPVAPDEP